jgi:hypothetical protein
MFWVGRNGTKLDRRGGWAGSRRAQRTLALFVPFYPVPFRQIGPLQRGAPRKAHAGAGILPKRKTFPFGLASPPRGRGDPELLTNVDMQAAGHGCQVGGKHTLHPTRPPSSGAAHVVKGARERSD